MSDPGIDFNMKQVWQADNYASIQWKERREDQPKDQWTDQLWLTDRQTKERIDKAPIQSEPVLPWGGKLAIP